MPYMSPLEVTAALRQRLQARRERRWIRELLSYDDHLLADLGFSRETLLWALKLPPEVNAGTVIGKLQLDAAAKLRLSIKDIR